VDWLGSEVWVWGGGEGKRDELSSGSFEPRPKNTEWFLSKSKDRESRSIYLKVL